MSTLAELIEEGKRLEKAFSTELAAGIVGVAPRGVVKAARGRLDTFFFINGPRLLAVAEAAVEMRRIGGCVLLPGGNDGCPCSICEATRAFDAAASGEGRG